MGYDTDSKASAPEASGGARQKGGLKGVILDIGWAALRQKLGCEVHRVGTVNSARVSQTRVSCGVIDARSGCPWPVLCSLACGYADDAELNAAANILVSGTASSVQGARLSRG